MNENARFFLGGGGNVTKIYTTSMNIRGKMQKFQPYDTAFSEILFRMALFIFK